MRIERCLSYPFLLAMHSVLAQGPYLPADLAYAMNVCSDTTFTPTDLLAGAEEDLYATVQGCLASGERNGTWIQFRVAASGTVGFTITGSIPTDLDFAVWGPFSAAPSTLTGPPVRCSYSSVPTITGLGGGAVDVTEGAGGDGWVGLLNVQVDQIYVLYAMNFSVNGATVGLSWQLSNGASLECLPPPIAGFSASASAIEPGETVSFTDITEGEPFAWEWAFPGGSPELSFEQDPADILYAEAGCYDVTLTAFNAAGESTLAATCQVLVDIGSGLASSGGGEHTILQDADGVMVRSGGTSALAVEVVDALGRTVDRRSGQGTLRFTTADLPSGPVIMTVSHGDVRRVHRILRP